MEDSWKIRVLFKFDPEPLKIFNDTQEEVIFKSWNGQDHKISTNGTLSINRTNDGFIIQNTDTIKFSDNSVCKTADFNNNLLTVTHAYRNSIRKGQIKRGVEFLEYHYGFTKNKKVFLEFIKYYFLSQYWLKKEEREKDWIVDEWIKTKEKKRERSKYILFISLGIIVLLFGIICLPDLKELLFGAILGLVLSTMGKFMDKIFSK